MFERFSASARRVVVLAQDEARLLGHEHIGTEHILLGVLRDNTPTSSAVADLGISFSDARQQISQAFSVGNTEPAGHLPFTPPAKQTLEGAAANADRLGHVWVAPSHLLLGLLDASGGAASRILLALGGDLDELARRAEQLAAAEEASSRSDRSTEARPVASTPRPGRHPRHRQYQYQRDVGDVPTTSGQAGSALAQALRRYGRHDEGCPGAGGCTCGLQNVLDTLDSPDSP